PLREQETEAPIGVLGKPKARELAHRPELAAVHRLVHAAGVWILARVAERALVVARNVFGGVEWLDLHVREGGEARRALLALLIGRLQPLPFASAHAVLIAVQARGLKSPAAGFPRCPRKSP